MYNKMETNIHTYLSLWLTPSLAFKELVKHSLKIFRTEPYILLWVLTTLYHRPNTQHKQRNNIFMSFLMSTKQLCLKCFWSYPKRLRNDLKAGKRTSATASLRDSRNSLSGTVHWHCLWWSSSNWELKVLNLSFTDALDIFEFSIGPLPLDWTVRHCKICRRKY